MVECRALKELVQNPNIIIKPADKGSKIVILDRQHYLLEANRQLNNPKYYQTITQSIQLFYQAQTNPVLVNSIYFPKFTKTHLPGRFPLKFLQLNLQHSTDIDYFLGPFSTKHPSYIKDTYHFLDIIRPMAVPTQAHLFTIDIDSLYSNINTTHRLQIIRSAFHRFPDPACPDEALLQLLELCLTKNEYSQYYSAHEPCAIILNQYYTCTLYCT